MMNSYKFRDREKINFIPLFRRFVILLTYVFFVLGCHKDLTEVRSYETARVSFYNASEEIAHQFGNDFYGCTILMDSATSNKQSYFYQTSARFNSGNFRFQYPNTALNAGQQQPWINYLRIPPGSHDLTLVDTALHVLHISELDAHAGEAGTVFFTDSLGLFRTVVLADEELITSNSARIRLLQLSPDFGAVLTTIDGHLNDLLTVQRFTDVSPYTEIPLKAANDTLKIRLYAKGDTSLLLASSSVQAQSGHSYTLILSGYLNFQTYLNDAGEQRNISPDLKLKVIRSY